jgi:hypothetical protein
MSNTAFCVCSEFCLGLFIGFVSARSLAREECGKSLRVAAQTKTPIPFLEPGYSFFHPCPFHFGFKRTVGLKFGFPVVSTLSPKTASGYFGVLSPDRKFGVLSQFVLVSTLSSFEE